MKKICILIIFFVFLISCKDEVFAINLDDKVVNGESLEERVVSAIERRDNYIVVEDFSITEEDVSQYYVEILYRHPELFYVSRSIRIFRFPDRSYISTILPVYEDEESYGGDWFLEMMDKPLGMIDDDMTTLEKILFVHDYLCANLEYGKDDTSKREYHSIVGVVTEGKVVCEGYSKAFQYYMNQLEIPCRVVVGDMEDGEAHAWNQVQIDGSWYMIDVTHDDPTPDAYGRVCHTHFLVSAEQIPERTWERNKYHICNSKKYENVFWNNVESQMIYHDGAWYYVSTDDKNGMNLYRHDFKKHSLDEKGDVVLPLSEEWIVFGRRNAYWIEDCGRIAQFEDKIIYNTPKKIMQCDFNGENVVCIADETMNDKWISGLKMSGDHLLYQLRADYGYEKEHEKITVSMKRNPLSVGMVFKDSESNASYQVLHSSSSGGTVLYRKSLVRNVRKLVIPKSVRCDGRNYRVVSVAKNAFQNNENISKVVLPYIIHRKMNQQKRSCFKKRNNGKLVF
ncbi:MAG: hypothetical protein E7264_03330 [Lachnospiraceae bacterium]|nr:hypothetical protein [Lachnospiraceae bacterium]